MDYDDFSIVWNSLSIYFKTYNYYPGHYSFDLFVIDVVTLHCVGFTWTCLPICHDCPIKSINDVAQNWIPYLLIHLFLRWIHIKNKIIHERHLLWFAIFDYQLLFLGNPVQHGGIAVWLFCIEWAKAAEYFNITIFLLHLFLLYLILNLDKMKLWICVYYGWMVD